MPRIDRFSKIKHALIMYDFHTVIDQVLLNPKTLGLNLYMTDMIFNLYTFGAVFILKSPTGRTTRSLYDLLRSYKLIKPLYKIHLLGTPHQYPFLDHINHEKVHFVKLPAIVCELSPYMKHHLQEWGFLDGFKNLYKRIQGFNYILNHILKRPILKRTVGNVLSVNCFLLTPSYVKSVQGGLHRIWKHHHVDLSQYMPVDMIRSFIIKALRQLMKESLKESSIINPVECISHKIMSKNKFGYYVDYNRVCMDRIDFLLSGQDGNGGIYTKEDVKVLFD